LFTTAYNLTLACHKSEVNYLEFAVGGGGTIYYPCYCV